MVDGYEETEIGYRLETWYPHPKTGEIDPSVSLLPYWTPIPIAGSACLSLDIVLFDENVRGAGLGHYFINAVLQSVTRNASDAQLVVARSVHFPLFMLLDSHHGWMRDRATSRFRPAVFLYPRHFPANTKEKIEENKKATHAFVDVLWSTPLIWALKRDWTLDKTDSPKLPYLQLNEKIAVFHGGETNVSVRLGKNISIEFEVTPVNVLLANRPTLATNINNHCKGLGNSDKGSTPVLVLSLKAFPLRSLDTPEEQIDRVILLLGFLIDHSRVMFRPIAFTDDLIAYLKSLPQPFSEILLSKFMPKPAPRFTTVDAFQLWVPARKERSTGMNGHELYVGEVTELRLFFMDTADDMPFSKVGDEDEDERAQKKQRTMDCINCGGSHWGQHEQFAFCSRSCSSKYYQ